MIRQDVAFVLCKRYSQSVLLIMKIFILLLFVCYGSSACAQSADIILFNGKIFTSDSRQPYARALAIKGNRIIAVGTDQRILKLISSKTQKIDLAGRTVVPGFNDAHEHLGFFAPVGQSFTSDFSVEGPGKIAVLDSVSKLYKIARPGQWIIGPIGLAILQDTVMRKALDSIAPDHPVYLQVMWGHGAIVNSKALAVLNIPDTAADPLGGWYARSPGSRRITGALFEYAQWPVWHAAWTSEPGNLVNALRSYALLQLQTGITTAQDMSCCIEPSALSRIFSEANLPLRVRIIPMPGATANGRSLSEWKKVDPHPSRLTYLSGVKYLLDGTPLEENAMMKKPYHDSPAWYGRLDIPVDTLKQILREALASGTQLMIHIAGDSTLALVLSLMKQLGDGETWKSRRVRIEHNATANITPSEANDLRAMGALIMHTPKYNRSSHLRSLIDRGIIVGISPDGTLNPFQDIMFTSNGQDNPRENISREQAVIAFTRTNAYAEFREKEKGTLAKGMLADLAVLSQDIFTIPFEQLPATKSVLTIIDGNIVYKAPGYDLGNDLPGTTDR